MFFDDILVNRIRFEYKGLISLEDLYGLSSEELNELYKKYNKEYAGEGLIEESRENKILKMKMDAIKHVFDYKEKMKKEHQEEIKQKQRKDKLMKALEEKELQSLSKMSKEDLEDMLKNI